jgi:ubiquinone/menaquinone biosynthesis C-methylase UbiE
MGGGSCPLRLSIYNRRHAREGFESSSSSIVLVDFIIKCMVTMKMELAEIYRVTVEKVTGVIAEKF